MSRKREALAFKPLSKVEKRYVQRIGRRAARLLKGTGFDAQHFEMDVQAVHNAITPLRLDELARADEVHFLHDISGILVHLDRKKIELRRHFVPRFAVGEG